MYVTSDAIISPVAKYIKDSEKPKFTIMSGAYEDKQTVGIYSLKSDTDIYYKVVNDNDDYCFEPVEPTDFIKYEDELLISKSSIVYAYAVTKDSNRSEIEQLVVKISDEGETNPIEPPTTEEVTTPKPIETTSEEVTTLNPIETTSDEIVTTEKVTTPISTETTTNQEVTTNAPTNKLSLIHI